MKVSYIMDKMRIAIIGLGYVGLPLARLFATKYSVVGFDVKQERVSALSLGEDTTKEVSEESLKSVLSDHLPGRRGNRTLFYF